MPRPRSSSKASTAVQAYLLPVVSDSDRDDDNSEPDSDGISSNVDKMMGYVVPGKTMAAICGLSRATGRASVLQLPTRAVACTL